MQCKLCKFKDNDTRFGDVRASGAELFARVVAFIDNDGVPFYQDVRISLLICLECGVIRASKKSLQDISAQIRQD